MADEVEALRTRLRSSLDPVSAFYLVDSPTAIEQMLAKATALEPFGLTPVNLAAIRATTAEWLSNRSPPASFPCQIWLEFKAEGQIKPGLVKFAYVPSRGVEVQLILPGVVAANAPGFLVDGFWCVFMPPSFYE
jgi:hypothetical protein